jgi:hypothetical protein
LIAARRRMARRRKFSSTFNKSGDAFAPRFAQNVYIADSSNHVIRKVTNGTITIFAGIGGRYGYFGDGGPANSALLNHPVAVRLDPANNVFIADTNNCRVREINAQTGIISTVARHGQEGHAGFLHGDGHQRGNHHPVHYRR